jgi:hypothetical protein
MRNYRHEIKSRAAKNTIASIKGYKVIDMQDGDKVLGKIVVEGASPNVYEVKTPVGLKELDLSKYNHQIDHDMKIVELNERYAN